MPRTDVSVGAAGRRGGVQSGRARHRVAVALSMAVAGAVALLLPSGLEAQDEGGQERQPPAADTAQEADGTAVYRREVFEYPRGNRRNPFAPVDAGQRVGPEFENLVLTGVIYSPSIGSVAVLLDRSTGRRYRVRDGQSIGDARVMEIRQGEVVFNVTTMTRTRQEVLQVEKEEEESQG